MINNFIDLFFNFHSKFDTKYSNKKQGFIFIYFKNLITLFLALLLAAIGLFIIFTIAYILIYIFVSVSNFLFLLSPFTDKGTFYSVYMVTLFILYFNYVFTKETQRDPYD